MLSEILPKSKISARENLHWLFILRNIMIAGEAFIILFTFYVLKVPLHKEELWLVLISIGSVNLYTWIRLETDTPVTELEIFSQITLDVFAIASLLYLTGGATNPVIWIFLLPLIITAIILPPEYIWYMVIITTTCYTLLVGYNIPLPSIEPFTPHPGMHETLISPEHQYFNLHIFGMWFGFVFSACMVAFFVSELAKTLGERERTLADAREKELRNELVVSLGSLAASAAHDMSTPLGTMAIITHEMAQSYPQHRFPDLQEKMLVMKNQIHRCKEALSVMSATAGELRAESAQVMGFVDYIDEVIDLWRTQKPDIKLNLFVDQETTAMVKIIAERSLTLALINILNNAAEASPRDLGIELHVSWNNQEVRLNIIDFGPGLKPEIIKRVGKQPLTTKKNGLGVGLFLTYSTITRLKGKIDISNKSSGGACVEIVLPLITDRIDDDRTETG